jgi:NADP-dependent aldehyde dehydrogenase
MGSINPVVVLPSALDPSRGWATAYAQSVTLGAGQFCTNPGLILGVAGEAWENFTTALAIEIGKLPAACMLHPGMAEAFRALRAEFLSQTGVRSIQGTENEASGALVGGAVAGVSGEDFRQNPLLQREVFGPFTLTVACKDKNELLDIIKGLEGQLTASLLGEEAEIEAEPELLEALQGRVGRLLFNGVPTGVEVCSSMHHGGPFPATTDARFTSVGLDAFRRWVKPLALQNAPATLLPDALRDENPLGIWRTVNGEWTRDSI